MIAFERSGKDVRATVEIKVPDYEPREFYFDWRCEDAAYAGLLTAEMRNQINAALAAIRREEYNNGWRDAKAKQGRQSIFIGSW